MEAEPDGRDPRSRDRMSEGYESLPLREVWVNEHFRRCADVREREAHLLGEPDHLLAVLVRQPLVHDRVYLVGVAGHRRQHLRVEQTRVPDEGAEQVGVAVVRVGMHVPIAARPDGRGIGLLRREAEEARPITPRDATVEMRPLFDSTQHEGRGLHRRDIDHLPLAREFAGSKGRERAQCGMRAGLVLHQMSVRLQWRAVRGPGQQHVPAQRIGDELAPRYSAYGPDCPNVLTQVTTSRGYRLCNQAGDKRLASRSLGRPPRMTTSASASSRSRDAASVTTPRLLVLRCWNSPIALRPGGRRGRGRRPERVSGRRLRLNHVGVEPGEELAAILRADAAAELQHANTRQRSHK
jgi:hypothetical protein